MSRNSKKILMTAAVNTGAYGVDAIAAGTGHAMQTIELKITPMEGDQIDRPLDDGQMGNRQVLLVGTHVKVTGKVELAGAGTKNQAPAFDPVLQGGGLVGTSSANNYSYSRVTDNSEKDVTFYVYKDGALHKVLGARLTYSYKLAVGELPTIDFDITGLYGGIVAGAIPAPNFSAFINPVKVGATYTTFKMGTTAGNAAEMKMLDFEMAENNEIIFDENTIEERIYLTDFKPDGKFIIEAPALGSLNPFTKALSEEIQHIELIHGTTEGNITKILLPKVQLGRVDYDNKDGRITYSIPFRAIGTGHQLIFG